MKAKSDLTVASVEIPSEDAGLQQWHKKVMKCSYKSSRGARSVGVLRKTERIDYSQYEFNVRIERRKKNGINH